MPLPKIPWPNNFAFDYEVSFPDLTEENDTQTLLEEEDEEAIWPYPF